MDSAADPVARRSEPLELLGKDIDLSRAPIRVLADELTKRSGGWSWAPGLDAHSAGIDMPASHRLPESNSTDASALPGQDGTLRRGADQPPYSPAERLVAAAGLAPDDRRSKPARAEGEAAGGF